MEKYSLLQHLYEASNGANGDFSQLLIFDSEVMYPKSGCARITLSLSASDFSSLLQKQKNADKVFDLMSGNDLLKINDIKNKRITSDIAEIQMLKSNYSFRSLWSTSSLKHNIIAIYDIPNDEINAIERSTTLKRLSDNLSIAFSKSNYVMALNAQKCKTINPQVTKVWHNKIELSDVLDPFIVANYPDDELYAEIVNDFMDSREKSDEIITSKNNAETKVKVTDENTNLNKLLNSLVKYVNNTSNPDISSIGPGAKFAIKMLSSQLK